MKSRGMAALGFLLCLNTMAYIMTMANSIPAPGSSPALNPAELQSHFNATEEAYRWGGWQTDIAIVGDIVTGVQQFIQFIGMLIVGFPLFLLSINAPAAIRLAFGGLWSFLMFVTVFEFISGRDTGD